MFTFSKEFRGAVVSASLMLAALHIAIPSVRADDDIAYFESKIRPVLAERCYKCHSAKALANDKLKGGLQLDSRAGIRKGGDTGPAVVPSETAASLILSALHHEGDLQMPPDNKLSDAIIEDFTRWIESGAPDPRDGAVVEIEEVGVDIEAGKKHWAFQPLSKSVPPKVTDQAWVRTPSDQFIRAAQESKSIEANPLAGPDTLARRAYFDLIGLPPTPEQTAVFLADAEKDFDGAWSRLIDQLLASPHYGERWGRHWLDLVRFAESNGYAFDRDRPNAWRYRDWVIRALNADMPYDEFVRQQLAGDIFAGSAPEWDNSDKAAKALELVSATGFIVGGPFTTQQTQKERERSRYEQLDDMVHTLGTSMLGLTVGCARCHDHKYDPIGTHDYYEWAAMFSDVGFADIGVDLEPRIYRDAKLSYDKAHAPLVAARAEQEKLLQLFDAPDAMQSIGSRETSTVAPQALAMLNSPTVRNWAIDLAKRARPSADTAIDQAIENAYRIAYARPPSADEQIAMQAFIERQSQARESKAETAFQDFCHLLLCTNEFIYVD